MVVAITKLSWADSEPYYAKDEVGRHIGVVHQHDESSNLDCNSDSWDWRIYGIAAIGGYDTIDEAKAGLERHWQNVIDARPKTDHATIHGVGPDAPIVENSNGGRQSSCPYRADLLPPKACLEISKVLKYGADKYGVDNWRKISRADNLNHAMVHILAYLAGDRSDEHLSHAGCRILFAMETE